tara:strand:- start:87 stop:2252 length:2166 start_codon:yes stop_codon:yes gene_type:complete
MAERIRDLNRKLANDRRQGLRKMFTAILEYNIADRVTINVRELERAVGKPFSKIVNLLSAHLLHDVIQLMIVEGTDSGTAQDSLADSLHLMRAAVNDPTKAVMAQRYPCKPLLGYHTQIQDQANHPDKRLTVAIHEGLPEYDMCWSESAGIFPDIEVRPAASAVSKAVTALTHTTPTPAKEVPMPTDDNANPVDSGFDLEHMTSLTMALSASRAREDEVTYQHNPVNAITEASEDAIRMIGEEFKLGAKQRLSLASSVELMCGGMPEITDGKYFEDEGEVLATLRERGLLEEQGDDVEFEVMTPVAAKAEPVAVNPDLKTAINVMVKQGLGKDAKAAGFTDIDVTLTEVKQLRVDAEKFAEEIKYLKGRSFTAPVQVTGEQVVDGDTLTYEVVQKNAMQLFKNPRTGKAIKQLNFDIPTLVWKDAKGDVAKHPMVPVQVDHYQFRATHLIKFLTGFIMGKNIWCHGHTGTGKTTLPEQVAAVIQFPVFPINLDGNIERADLVGQMDIVNDGGTSITEFKEGILPRAMTQPCILVLDEIDAGKPDVMFVIQRATEGKGLLLTEDGGRLVKPHPLFRFVATANSRGQGDEYGVYAGVRPMNGALLNRFPIFIEVDYMTKEEESVFLKKTYGLADEVIDNITTFAGMCRKAFAEGETTVPVSPRDTMAMCEMYSFFETIFPTKAQATEFAVTTSVIDRAPLDNRQRVIELADRCFASCKFTGGS